MQTEERQLTTKQAGQILDITPNRVRQLAREGVLDAKETPYGRLFSRESVLALKQERERKYAR